MDANKLKRFATLLREIADTFLTQQLMVCLLYHLLQPLHHPGGAMVKAMAYNSRGHEFNSRPSCCLVTTLGKLFTHLPPSPSSIIWTSHAAAMSCDWKGNRKPGVALAMRHRLT